MSAGVLQTFCKAYSQQAQSSALGAQGVLSKQLSLLQAKLTNKSGGSADLGILRGLGNENWGILSWTNASTTAVDLTAAIQAGTSTQVVSTTVNDGFVVSSKVQFGLVGLTISQAEGGTPAYEYMYWNGSAWSALTTIAALSAYATGYKLAVVFLAPNDWAQGGSGTGVPQGQYNVRVRATTRTTTAIKVTGAVVGAFIDYVYAVANNSSFTWPAYMVKGDRRFQFESGDYLLPYFGTANAANLVSGAYLVDY